MTYNREDLFNKLEAVLYDQGGMISSKDMSDILQISLDVLSSIIEDYNNAYRAFAIIFDDKQIILRVAHKYQSLIDSHTENKLKEKLSDAGMEVLSIVLYKGMATAGEVEYIRGVKSDYTLRQLTTRGYLNKNKKGMSNIYTPSADLLAFLGITSIKELPERDMILSKIHKFEKEKYEESSR